MSQQFKLGSRSTVSGNDGEMYYVQYHNTKVVKWNDKKIILNSDGWKTATTKTRMNQTANQFGLGFSVRQKDYSWYVDFKGKEISYHDQMELSR
jgi:hypothetical protein